MYSTDICKVLYAFNENNLDEHTTLLKEFEEISVYSFKLFSYKKDNLDFEFFYVTYKTKEAKSLDHWYTSHFQKIEEQLGVQFEGRPIAELDSILDGKIYIQESPK